MLNKVCYFSVHLILILLWTGVLAKELSREPQLIIILQLRLNSMMTNNTHHKQGILHALRLEKFDLTEDLCVRSPKTLVLNAEGVP